MAKKKKRTTKKNTGRTEPTTLYQAVGKKKFAYNFFLSLLLIVAVIYGIYHLIIIDTIEGLQLISGIVLLVILYMLSKFLIAKLKK